MKVEEIKLAFENNQKFELGLVEDLLGSTKGVTNFSKNIDISLKELASIKNYLNVDSQDLKKDMDVLKDALGRIEKIANQINTDPNTVAGYKEGKKAILLGEQKIKDAQKAL